MGRMDCIDLAGTCKRGNEPSVSIKCGEFLDQLRTGQFLKKDSVAWSKYAVLQHIRLLKERKRERERENWRTYHEMPRRVRTFGAKGLPSLVRRQKGDSVFVGSSFCDVFENNNYVEANDTIISDQKIGRNVM